MSWGFMAEGGDFQSWRSGFPELKGEENVVVQRLRKEVWEVFDLEKKEEGYEKKEDPKKRDCRRETKKNVGGENS